MITYMIDGKPAFIGHALHDPKSYELLGIAVYSLDKPGPPHKPLYFQYLSAEYNQLLNEVGNDVPRLIEECKKRGIPDASITVAEMDELVRGNVFPLPDLAWETLLTPEKVGLAEAAAAANKVTD